MKYRRFGRTNLSMPVFSCGGMRYQQKWEDFPETEIDPKIQENLEATIQRSVALGINHIETARGYGSSEMQLGRILPSFPREKLIIQTKVAPVAEAKDFLVNFETSMKYLRLDYVDLLSLHGINNAETLTWSMQKGGCLAMARRLQKEGRVRHIGFSTHASLDHILQTVETGEFDYVNLHWYYVNKINGEAITAARRHDMGVFIISPNDKGGRLYDPPAKLVELCKPVSPMIFNDLFCLACPEVHTLSLGAARPSDFDEHIKALEFYDQAGAVSAPIAQRLDAEVNKLGPEWLTEWWRGIPEHYELPGDINLREITRLWIYAKALDLVTWGKMRYNLLGNAGHWFPGVNAAKQGEHDWSQVALGTPLEGKIVPILQEAHAMLLDAPKERLSKGD
jgi:uncharacterized protein